MNLTGSFLGLSTFQYEQPLPIKNTFNKIKIYGNATIDKLHIRTRDLSNDDLQNMIITNPKAWTPDTILLVEFEDNIAGGNISNVVNPVTKWQVTRKEENESVYRILDTVDVDQIQYIDYTTQQNKNYKYHIHALTDSEISEPLESNNLDTDYYGWYLVGTDQDGIIYVYMLDLNVNFDGFQNEEDFTEYQTYQKYNAFSKGERNFLRGSISAIAGDISTNTNELLQSVDYIDDLRNRIQNISTKYLKSRKGEIFKVKTYGFNANPLDNAISSQPYIVKFNFVQCEDI